MCTTLVVCPFNIILMCALSWTFVGFFYENNKEFNDGDLPGNKYYGHMNRFSKVFCYS